MANLILQNSKYVKIYTKFNNLFAKIPLLQEYDYILTDLELNCTIPDIDISKAYTRMTGATLFKTLVSYEFEPQFIWGVLSALEKDTPLVGSSLPLAQKYSGFWHGSPVPQLKNARFELVAVDSSLTLFIGLEDALAAQVKDLYPDIQDLDQANHARAAQSTT